MSIQAVESQSVSVGKGIKRGIDAGAEGMIMEIVQSSQYTKPIPSCVRELASNAVDSQNEKEKYRKIFRGEARPEDYFIERDGALYADSNWDASYYNNAYLSDKTKVELEYVEGNGLGHCDKFVVRDHGVGIGGPRLKVLVNVGVSTKRNRTDAIGGFGIGSRSPLSTDADYYNTTCVYNGLKIKLKTFSNKMDSLIGKFNTSGEKNIEIEMPDGSTIYAEKTDEKNYTEVVVPALKREKNDYINAVKEQLMFFDNIDFNIIDEYGSSSQVRFQATIEYESDDILIAKNMPFQYPFVVITNGTSKICYGIIDFDVLGIERKRGPVGIKTNIRQVKIENGVETVIKSGVDVIPSREALRWNQNTKNHIFEKFEAAQLEASKMVEKELVSDNYFDWVHSCSSVFYNNGNSVLNSLYCIIDKSKIMTTYEFDNGLKARYISPYANLGIFFNTRQVGTTWKKGKQQIVRTKETMSGTTLYYGEEGVRCLGTKDEYIIDLKGQFNMMTMKDELSGKATSDINSALFGNKVKDSRLIEEVKEEIYDLVREKGENYEEVEIDENWSSSIYTHVDEGSDGQEVVQHVLTPAEKRKLNQEVSIGYLAKKANLPDSNYSNHNVFVRNSMDVKVGALKNMDPKTYWYATNDDKDKLQLTALLMSQIDYRSPAILLQECRGINFYIVTKKLAKHFDESRHINKFFCNVEERQDGKIELSWSPLLTNWYTRKKLFPIVEHREAYWVRAHYWSDKLSKHIEVFDNDMRERQIILQKIVDSFNLPYNYVQDSVYVPDRLFKYMEDVSNQENLEKYSLHDKKIDVFPSLGNENLTEMSKKFSEYMDLMHPFLSESGANKPNSFHSSSEKRKEGLQDAALFIEAKAAQEKYRYPDSSDIDTFKEEDESLGEKLDNNNK